MKKILLTLAVALMAVTTINAQSHGWFWFGPKVGLTSTATDVKVNADEAQAILDGAQSYNAGIMTRFNLPLSIFSLHIQPELMYNWQKGTLKDDNGENIAMKDFTINSFSIPVLAGVGMDLGLFNARVQAGPVVKFNSNSNIGSIGDKSNAPIDWKDVTYTWAAGVGIDLFSFIMVDFRYLGGWNEGKEPTNFGEIFNFENVNKETSTWNISLGVMF